MISTPFPPAFSIIHPVISTLEFPRFFSSIYWSFAVLLKFTSLIITEAESITLLLAESVGETLLRLSESAPETIPILLTPVVGSVAPTQRLICTCVADMILVVELAANEPPPLRAKSFPAHHVLVSRVPAVISSESTRNISPSLYRADIMTGPVPSVAAVPEASGTIVLSSLSHREVFERILTSGVALVSEFVFSVSVRINVSSLTVPLEILSTLYPATETERLFKSSLRASLVTMVRVSNCPFPSLSPVTRDSTFGPIASSEV